MILRGDMIKLLVFAAIAIIYFTLRLPNLTLQPIFADEAIYIRWAQVMKAEPTLRFVSLSDGKTPLFMWAMTPLLKVVKDPLLAGRLLSVLSGSVTLAGVFFLAWRVLNRNAAYWASFFYAICPYTVFFDRMALVDSMLAAFTVWVIYFAVWLTQSLRLDLAMILGHSMGGALLVKTPAMTNLLILPFSIIGMIGNISRKKLLKLLFFWIVSIAIALFIYNLLRLGPGFQQISLRNTDYIFSPFELKNRPLDPFIPHLRDLADWFPKLFTFPVLITVFVGAIVATVRFNRLALLVFIWALIPLLLEMAFLKTFTARYLLPSIPPLLVIAGFGLINILERMKAKGYIKILMVFIIFLPLPIKFNYQLIVNPPPDDLPIEERKGYFEDWTAGYGFKEMAGYIIEQGKGSRVVLGTEGFFGTLPDGIQIYLDKENVAIIGSTATISAQIRDAAKNNPTYFVGNKKSLEGSVSNVVVVKEYPKVKPKDKTPQDASVLYQVFPND